MTMRIDHIGIAVADVQQALAFYCDALGLERHGIEEVAAQHVRAHFLRAGDVSLELLEATAPDSPVGRYLAKRGPGLHHITLRVPDIRQALARLASLGIRLIDPEPRAGAEGALVAFVHPSSAHGVLVELQQRPEAGPTLRIGRHAMGDLTLTALHDGPIWLDGGAMFGVVPRELWGRVTWSDARNRVPMTMRPLLVEGPWGSLLIDCGAGDKGTPRWRDMYGLGPRGTLDAALAEAGASAASIEAVLPTHLHFDHIGGATVVDGGRLRPRFPRARHLIRRQEWDDATHPHERSRASYRPDDILPLLEAGVVDFFDADREIRPGVRVERTGGHTGQHQIVYLQSGGRTAVVAADLVPTTAHLPDAWIAGYDLFPMETLAVKKRLLQEAMEREYLMFFAHDPHVAAGYVRETNGRRYVEPVL